MSGDIYRVKPLRLGADYGSVEVPGSKSITNRALLLAAFASGVSELHGVLFSDDTEHCIGALKSLGIPVDVYRDEFRVVIHGCNDTLPSASSVYVGSGGTTARFLSAMVTAIPGVREFSASEQMSKRPMGELLNSLTSGGAQVHCHKADGHFPFTLISPSKMATHYEIDGSRSSQFLSALLMMGAVAKDEVSIEVKGELIAKSYVDITIKMLHSFGVSVVNQGYKRFFIPSGSTLQGCPYQIEPDISGASYFFALPAVLGGQIEVKHVHRDSMQGDIAFLEVLEQMGCSIEEKNTGITVIGPQFGMLQGVSVHMNDFSDQTLTLGAIAPFGNGITEISGVGHIRYQESDRLSALSTELHRMGVPNDVTSEGIVIEPHEIGNAEIETYEDHRMAMAFTLPGLYQGSIGIRNPNCCDKTFPNYFEIIDQLVEHHEVNYFLVGFMGVGKSTVGRELAASLNREFIDLDSWIEEQQGCSIPEIFEKGGESLFRDIEHSALRDVTANHCGAIIATGGGIVEDPRNFDLLFYTGRSFYLQDSFDTLYHRISSKEDQNRPLAAKESKEELYERYQRRDPLYTKVATPISREGQSVKKTVILLKGYIAPQ